MRPILFSLAAAFVAASGAACAQPAAPVQTQAAYAAQCAHDFIAQYPNARAQAGSICASQWEQVVAAGPMADALIAAAPATGARFDPAAARAAVQGLRGYETNVAPARLTVSWRRNGEPIPFRLEDALRARGATVAMIGCMRLGFGEGSSVHRVTAPGKTPFNLTISSREAAVASQSSDFSADAAFAGAAPTLAQLQRDGMEWTPACPL